MSADAPRVDVTVTSSKRGGETTERRLRSLSGGDHRGAGGANLVLYPIEVKVEKGGVTSEYSSDFVKQSERKEETVRVERPLSFILPDTGRSTRRLSQERTVGLMRPCDLETSTISSISSGPVTPRSCPGTDHPQGAAPLATADSSSDYCGSSVGPSAGGGNHSRQSSIDSRLSSNSPDASTFGSGAASTASHFVVVAIDFGTTYSGYAFSFTRDPESIHMMRRWEGGDPGIVNQKTPTTLLLQPDGTFHSFGFTARDFYHDLDAQEAKRWLYFEKFKMTLHHNAVSVGSPFLRDPLFNQMY